MEQSDLLGKCAEILDLGLLVVNPGFDSSDIPQNRIPGFDSSDVPQNRIWFGCRYCVGRASKSVRKCSKLLRVTRHACCGFGK